MKKLSVILVLVAGLGLAAGAQEKALPSKYSGYNTVTRFDSTGVYMEESGLSHVQIKRKTCMEDTNCI